MVGLGGAVSKVAVTVCSADIVRVQAPVPVQSPLQPVNTEPASGVAVNTTEVPSPKSASQVAPEATRRRARDRPGAGAGLGDRQVVGDAALRHNETHVRGVVLDLVELPSRQVHVLHRGERAAPRASRDDLERAPHWGIV